MEKELKLNYEQHLLLREAVAEFGLILNQKVREALPGSERRLQLMEKSEKLIRIGNKLMRLF